MKRIRKPDDNNGKDILIGFLYRKYMRQLDKDAALACHQGHEKFDMIFNILTNLIGNCTLSALNKKNGLKAYDEVSQDILRSLKVWFEESRHEYEKKLKEFKEDIH